MKRTRWTEENGKQFYGRTCFGSPKTLSDGMQYHCLVYGYRQILADAAAGVKGEKNKLIAMQEKLDALKNGTAKVRRHSDRVSVSLIQERVESLPAEQRKTMVMILRAMGIPVGGIQSDDDTSSVDESPSIEMENGNEQFEDHPEEQPSTEGETAIEANDNKETSIKATEKIAIRRRAKAKS